MHNIVFNSIPVEDIDDKWGSDPQKERIKELLFELRRYGIPEEDLFTPEDLLEMKHIQRVIITLCKLIEKAEKDPGSVLPK